jgi:hypothetical protein
MVLYNTSLSHKENEYNIVVDENIATLGLIVRAVQDVFTVWMGESSLKLWVRGWLLFLSMGVMSPLAFLPHPFAITNVVGMAVIMVTTGREMIRIRGFNKNMGWQHLLGFTPVIIVNILCLTTDSIDGEKLSWDNAGGDAYEQARYVVVIYNTVTLGISVVFDFVDTILYHGYGHTDIERSKWTTDQLTQSRQDTTNETAAATVSVSTV